MKLRLVRDIFGKSFTLGKFYVDEKFLGFTCEDKDRTLEDDKDCDGNHIDKGEKVYGETAIPRGIYDVVLSFSHRFQKVMPEVINVPQFSGVRIHGGNRAKDTLGCPLLGAQRLDDGVANCAGVNTRLIELIQQAEDRGEPVTLEVK